LRFIPIVPPNRKSCAVIGWQGVVVRRRSGKLVHKDQLADCHITIGRSHRMDDKELYREKLEAKIKELKTRVELLEAKAAQIKAESELEFNKHLAELRQKRDALQGKLDEIKKSGGEAWQDLRSGMEKATDELKQAIDRAMDKFR
jgi:DNA repair exonuclease SbcCD ATPase subunit